MAEYGKLVGTSATTTMELAPDKMGAPGTHQWFTIVPMVGGKERELSEPHERDFHCAIQLVKHPSPERNINGSFTASDGGSFLSPPAGSAALAVSTSQGEFRIESNRSLELSLVSMKVSATSFADAEHIFREAVTPLLDHLAYVANVPVRTSLMKIHDRKDDVQRIFFVSPYMQETVSDHLGAIQPELRPVFALYREARNSDSPYYRLLCLFKIIEGVCKLKGYAIRQAKKRGMSVEMKDDLVPEHPDLALDLRPNIGNPIQTFQQSVLTRRYRDAVAHFQLRSDSSVLHVSSPSDFARFAEAAFAAELCARVMIENYKLLVACLEAGARNSA